MRKLLAVPATLVAMLLLQAPGALAASTSGSLDRTFAGDGIAYLPQTAYAVAVQPDGKIVVAGGAITRYNRDGTLDRSFSGDGQVPMPFAAGGYFGAVAIQPNGRIVVGGRAEVHNTNELAFVRYLPDGSLDRSFSGNGKLVTRKVGSMDVEEVSDIAIGPDGTIAASAYVTDRHYLFGVIRLTRRGVPDTTFSGDGVAITRFSRHNAFAESVAVQPDGAIVAVGAGRARARFAVSRYLPDGTHDPAFSGDGKRTIGLGGTWSWASAVGLQDDGRIVIAGTVRHGPRRLDYGHLSIAVARCNLDGSLDPRFAGDGKRWTSADGNLRATSLAIQADRKIVVGGESTPTVDEYPDNFALVRYATDGQLDPSFAAGGIRVQSFRLDDWIEDMTLQPNGRIVVVGASQGRPPRGYAVARYLP
jgi:uncharacterized delta-60 repeat protein